MFLSNSFGIIQHTIESRVSTILPVSFYILLTTVLQFPQCDGLLLKSEHAPEQHAGDTPVQGVALQEPQRVTLLLRLVQTPLQHEDWGAEHCWIPH